MGNKERNSYVVQQLIEATCSLLQTKAWQEISISEIVTVSQVSRNSFYRNFNSKEELLKKQLQIFSNDWLDSIFDEEHLSLAEKLKILFSHFEKHAPFYQKLHQQNLMYLFREILTDSMDLTTESSAVEVYTKAYVVYMLYGWIETWLQRGMKESAEEIAQLFSAVQ